MKHIKKRPELPSFVEWKAKRTANGRPTTYDHIKPKRRRVIKQALLEEQGFICCYCGMRVQLNDSHIEHLKPQQHCTDEETVDYQNLLASCQGEEQKVHCGHNKKNWYDESLLVSPLQENCELHFEFTYDGKIKPSKDPALAARAQETIRQLGLDSDKLNALRREAIDHIFIVEELPEEELEQTLSMCMEPDEQGELPEYASAIQFLVQKELAELSKTSK